MAEGTPFRLPLYVDCSTAAWLLGVSEQHVRNLVARGSLPSTRWGGSVRIPLLALIRRVEQDSGERRPPWWWAELLSGMPGASYASGREVASGS